MTTLSITVITFNQEQFINKTLDSILNQDINFSYEIIVGDDASQDNTQKIIQEYTLKHPNIIRPVFREENIGHTANYIETTKLCKGKYISHIDGDDLMLPGKLQKQVDYLEANPKCSIVHHPVYYVDVNDKVTGKSKISRATTGSINAIVKANNIINSSNMFRRSSLDQHFYNMRKDLLLHDWLAHIIKAQYGSICFIPEYFGSYRVYKQSVIQSTSFIKQCNATLHTMECASKFKDVKMNSVKYGKSKIYFTLARHYFKKGFYKRSEYYLMKSCENRALSWDNFRYYIKLLIKKSYDSQINQQFYLNR